MGTGGGVAPRPAGRMGKSRGGGGAATNVLGSVGSRVGGPPPLIAHWNGAAWRAVKAPRQAGVLNAVTAVSTNDVWAVGDFINATGVQQTLIEQRNGRKWGGVPAPNDPTQPKELLSGAAAPPNDI